MRNAEEFYGQRSDVTRVMPAYHGPGQQPGQGARSGAWAWAGGPGSSGSGASGASGASGSGASGSGASGSGSAGAGRIRYAHSGVLPRAEPFCTAFQARAVHHDEGGGDGAGSGNDGGMEAGTWLAAGQPVGRHPDLWVLVCGGIAAVAAFAAAFVASGGVASHPAAPGTTVPAVVSQACPSPAAAPGR